MDSEQPGFSSHIYPSRGKREIEKAANKRIAVDQRPLHSLAGSTTLIPPEPLGTPLARTLVVATSPPVAHSRSRLTSSTLTQSQSTPRAQLARSLALPGLALEVSLVWSEHSRQTSGSKLLVFPPRNAP